MIHRGSTSRGTDARAEGGRAIAQGREPARRGDETPADLAQVPPAGACHAHCCLRGLPAKRYTTTNERARHATRLLLTPHHSSQASFCWLYAPSRSCWRWTPRCLKHTSSAFVCTTPVRALACLFACIFVRSSVRSLARYCQDFAVPLEQRNEVVTKIFELERASVLGEATGDNHAQLLSCAKVYASSPRSRSLHYRSLHCLTLTNDSTIGTLLIPPSCRFRNEPLQPRRCTRLTRVARYKRRRSSAASSPRATTPTLTRTTRPTRCCSLSASKPRPTPIVHASRTPSRCIGTFRARPRPQVPWRLLLQRLLTSMSKTTVRPLTPEIRRGWFFDHGVRFC